MQDFGAGLFKNILPNEHVSYRHDNTDTIQIVENRRDAPTARGEIDAMTKWIVRYAAEFGDDKAI